MIARPFPLLFLHTASDQKTNKLGSRNGLYILQGNSICSPGLSLVVMVTIILYYWPVAFPGTVTMLRSMRLVVCSGMRMSTQSCIEWPSWTVTDVWLTNPTGSAAATWEKVKSNNIKFLPKCILNCHFSIYTAELYLHGHPLVYISTNYLTISI